GPGASPCSRPDGEARSTELPMPCGRRSLPGRFRPVPTSAGFLVGAFTNLLPDWVGRPYPIGYHPVNYPVTKIVITISQPRLNPSEGGVGGQCLRRHKKGGGLDGQRLRQLRKSKGLTQPELADATGVPQQTISN